MYIYIDVCITPILLLWDLRALRVSWFTCGKKQSLPPTPSQIIRVCMYVCMYV